MKESVVFLENNVAESETVEVNLLKLGKAYLQHLWLILLCGILAAGAAFFITNRFITPQYKATVSIYVNSSKNQQPLEYVSSANLSTAQRLVSTYVNILSSNTVLRDIISSGDLPCTPAQIRQMMSAEQVDQTEMFTVSIVNPDPELATEIANTIAQVAPKTISTFVEGSSTKVIDYAEVPQVPYTPNYNRNITLGALAGILIALIGLTLRFLFDTRLQNEEDVRQAFDIPILGSIPDYMSISDDRKYAYEDFGPGTAHTDSRKEVK